MELNEILHKELKYLKKYNYSSIMISTTAKHALDFRVLPRRNIPGVMAISCFMINEECMLKDTLSFFDGKIDNFYIDVELKQNLNLFKVAKEVIQRSKLVTVKPNDTTIESCDLLIRNYFDDNLYNKKVIIIGTGNLASKMAVRLAERQADVYLIGRTRERVNRHIEALNSFLPKYSSHIQSIEESQSVEQVDLIVSFLSGKFTKDDILFPLIHQDTFIIDGGINNFSNDFIQRMLLKNVQITRLDTRIALPYQFLSTHEYSNTFFNDVYGQSIIQGVSVVAGGYIGKVGTVIVDSTKQPNQVIGIADGSGGVKKSEQLSETDRNNLHQIEKFISTCN